jgi:hypothetical protein
VSFKDECINVDVLPARFHCWGILRSLRAIALVRRGLATAFQIAQELSKHFVVIFFLIGKSYFLLIAADTLLISLWSPSTRNCSMQLHNPVHWG